MVLMIEDTHCAAREGFFKPGIATSPHPHIAICAITWRPSPAVAN